MMKRSDKFRLYLYLQKSRLSVSSLHSELLEYQPSSPDLVRAVLVASNSYWLAADDLEQSIRSTLEDELSTLISPAGTETTSHNGSGGLSVHGPSANLDLFGEDDGLIRTILGILRAAHDIKPSGHV